MHRLFLTFFAVLFFVQGAICAAQTAEERKVDALFAALGLPEILQIMRIEGLEHGAAVADGVFADKVDPEWEMIVDEIYAPDFMLQEFRAAFDEELQGSDVDAMLRFYTTQPGQTVIALEIGARRALLEPAVDAASKSAAAAARAADSRRMAMIDRYIAANNLIDANVAGALNANYAFTKGLLDGGALPSTATADDALVKVWEQEPEIRRSATEWLYAYLHLAYQPLSDADMETYIDFTQSTAGQELHMAIATAFDGLFRDIFRALGLASARFINRQEL